MNSSMFYLDVYDDNQINLEQFIALKTGDKYEHDPNLLDDKLEVITEESKSHRVIDDADSLNDSLRGGNRVKKYETDNDDEEKDRITEMSQS